MARKKTPKKGTGKAKKAPARKAAVRKPSTAKKAAAPKAAAKAAAKPAPKIPRPAVRRPVKSRSSRIPSPRPAPHKAPPLGANIYERDLDKNAANSPGVFKESRSAERVYFVEKLAANLSTVANIFVHSEEDGQVGTTVAKRGYQETAPNGDRFLVLLNGRRYIGPPGSAEYRIIEFDKYSLRIEQSEPKEVVPTVKSRPSLELLKQDAPEAKAELIWRIGLPISATVLCLLAIPMSFVNPRAGRSLNLMVAALLYMIYSNLLSIVQAWVAQQRIGPLLGMWTVHIVVLALVAFMFHVRLSVRPFRLGRG